MASGSDRASNEPTLADLNADYVSAFLRDLEVTPTKRYPQGSPFRSRAACKSLKRLANWLAEERVLKESPLERIKKAPEPKEVRQPLSDQELEQVRFAAGRSGSRDHALVVFMAGTGLRLNEARQLRTGDVNLGACQVTVRAMTSKRKKTRVVDFHSAVAREMERYLRTRRYRSALSDRRGKVLHRRWLRQALRPHQEEVKRTAVPRASSASHLGDELDEGSRRGSALAAAAGRLGAARDGRAL